MDDLHEQFAALPRYRRIETLVETGAVSSQGCNRLLSGQEREAFDRAASTEAGRLAIREAVDGYCAPEIKPDDVYEYDASNPHLITPETAWRLATVVWCDGENVHYRKAGSSKVHETPLPRFLDATRPGRSKAMA